MFKGESNKLFILICMLAMFIFIVGCSSNESQTTVVPNDNNSEPSDISIIMADRGIQVVEASPDINNEKYVKKLAELTNTNLDIELLPWSEYEQSLTLVFAGGEYPDLMEINGINVPQVAPAIETGVFTPLNDLIEEHAPNLKKFISEEQWNSPIVSKDGTIYAIPSTNYVRNNNVVMVRKDWLDNLGLDTPKTVEEYIDMLKTFKTEDPNGNGEQDEIPISGRENFAFVEAFFWSI